MLKVIPQKRKVKALFPVTLNGDRIILREFQLADAEVRWSYVSDPKVSRYQTWTPLADFQACKDMLASDIAEAQSGDRKQYLLAVELDGKIIGEAGLNLGSAHLSSGSIFYTMSRAYWRQGYATEAARVILKFAFETLNLHRVTATVNPLNTASRTLVTKKLNMQYEGRMRDASRLFQSNEWADADLFSLLQHEWQKQNTV